MAWSIQTCFASRETDVIRSLINCFRHRRDGYDRRGDAIFLAGRAPEPDALHVAGVSAAARDEALRIICASFEIPPRQMYCLRPDDELMEMYRSFNGARDWDRLEFESLGVGLSALPGGKVAPGDWSALRVGTVADVIRFVSDRRTGGGSPAS